MSTYFENLDKYIEEYFNILSPEKPDFLEEYIQTPEMQKQSGISVSCGTCYSKLFPEMRQLAPECKFRGCLHLKEPGCAVKNAVEHGTIMKSRYDNYVQFNELIVSQKPNY